MELVKMRIWMIMRWELNDDDVEVGRVITAYNTKEEAADRLKKCKKANNGLKYAVRSVYTWFPKEW
jgi:hypothetical protein